jgi:hypothetical protein
MNNRTPISRLLLCVALLVVSPLALGAGIQKPVSETSLRFFTKLRPVKTDFAFDLFVRNPSSKLVTISYGSIPCHFSFVLRVAGKEFPARKSDQFTFAKVCTMEIRGAKIPAHSTIRVDSGYPMGPEITKLLRAAKLKYAGEFHFLMSVVGSGSFTVLVYKTP